jgi:hypothetical protein
MVRDIRKGPVEEYWDRLREMMGQRQLRTFVVVSLGGRLRR